MQESPDMCPAGMQGFEGGGFLYLLSFKAIEHG